MSACGAEADLGGDSVVCARELGHKGNHVASGPVACHEYGRPGSYVTTAWVGWAQMPAEMRRTG